ncbi:unnamed protein product [Chrysodeixis includens]|uniref:Uncharacterized protein n=1 Tax=Chrysodeixis includens TaxID=689277 RepID=A0A9N8PXT3_CHRIL|nr:unnamed protein product [Chrysodeixis includens]
MKHQQRNIIYLNLSAHVTHILYLRESFKFNSTVKVYFIDVTDIANRSKMLSLRTKLFDRMAEKAIGNCLKATEGMINFVYWLLFILDN